jgi:hypothetical protein
MLMEAEVVGEVKLKLWRRGEHRRGGGREEEFGDRPEARGIVLKTKPVRWFNQKKPKSNPSPVF